MVAIRTCELPRDSLLRRYLDDRDAYTDCYVTELARPVRHEPSGAQADAERAVKLV